jgi:hypothetical protein
MGHIKIENSIAKQVNYDDIATAYGWAGTINVLDENGVVIPLLDENGLRKIVDGQCVYETLPQSSQDFIAGLYNGFSNQMVERACRFQEIQQGKLNYNAEQMIALFKSTTAVTWEE